MTFYDKLDVLSSLDRSLTTKPLGKGLHMRPNKRFTWPPRPFNFGPGGLGISVPGSEASVLGCTSEPLFRATSS